MRRAMERILHTSRTASAKAQRPTQAWQSKTERRGEWMDAAKGRKDGTRGG